jgi:hypothetical protein
MKKLFSLVIVSVFLASCTTQKIAYKTDTIQPKASTIPVSVNIKLFDERQNNFSNEILFAKSRQTKFEGKTMCFNSERHYKKGTVANQFTAQIAKHLNQQKVFNAVNSTTDTVADYYVTGDLTSFHGMQEFSAAAYVGGQYGLIGALATMNIKTPANIVIEIKNLKLYNKDRELIKEIGNFSKDYAEDLRVDGYCWCIYQNINQKLIDFNNSLSDILSDIIGYEYNARN